MYGLFNEFSKIAKKIIVRIDERLIHLFEKKNPNYKIYWSKIKLMKQILIIIYPLLI